MVTLNFAFLQPKADLGDNIVATPLGNENGLLENCFALVHISSSELIVDGEQRSDIRRLKSFTWRLHSLKNPTINPSW